MGLFSNKINSKIKTPPLFEVMISNFLKLIVTLAGEGTVSPNEFSTLLTLHTFVVQSFW
jgi:hypothetical protein